MLATQTYAYNERLSKGAIDAAALTIKLSGLCELYEKGNWKWMQLCFIAKFIVSIQPMLDESESWGMKTESLVIEFKCKALMSFLWI